MRLGLVARADNSGLGVQTWEFYRHMKPQKTLVVDISELNGNAVFPERYPENAEFSKGFPTPAAIDNFLADLDVVFVAEAPYRYELYSRARQLGVKTAVQYNYEFFDWLVYTHYPKPDMLIAPSKWNYEHIDAWCKLENIEHVYLHCPVNRDKLIYRQIPQARTFLHTAGRSAAFDRNGTKTVIEAAKYLTTPAQIVIHFQGEQGLAHQTTHTTEEYRIMVEAANELNNLTMVCKELVDYSDVYAMGDVLLLPRRYGGNCLPLNEALSCGLPAIMTDISPNNSFLPQDWLLPAIKINEFTPRTTVEIYGADPKTLALKIDEFYNYTEQQMLAQNEAASILAQHISWETMAPKYREALQELCTR